MVGGREQEEGGNDKGALFSGIIHGHLNLLVASDWTCMVSKIFIGESFLSAQHQ